MKWSWKLGEFAGIGVYMHATFLLLIGWVVLSTWLQRGSVADAAEGIAFILVLFAGVVLHEFGHALTARRFGIRTRDITLLPIGGAARLERMPDDPRQELWVALAGPAVSLLVAAALFVYLQLTTSLEAVMSFDLMGGSFVNRVMMANVFLAIFNMIPAFPMDGGRVVRALLAMRLEYGRATQVAAWLGQGMALLFGFVGLFSNPFLLFIALFVWIGASQESSMVQMKTALGGIPVSRAMISDFRTLSKGDSLAQAVQLILAGSEQDFPVVDDGRVIGVLTRADLLVALARQNQEAPVVDVMRKDIQTVDASEMLETAFARLQTCDCHALPVTRFGQLVGLLTADNVGEFMMIQAAITSGRKRIGTGPGSQGPGADREAA